MELIVIASVFVTALLSGVFGMAGGLLLLFALSLCMPLAQALVVHGAAQLMANGLRATLSARHIEGAVVFPYALAAGVTFLLCSASGLVLSMAAALIVTGTLPWLEPLFTRVRLASVERPVGSVLCGLLVTGLHLTAGVSGPLLDQFFLRTRLTRHQIVSTKAATQCLGHALKIVYFGELTGGLAILPSDTWLWLAVASVAGTSAGRLILDRLDEAAFRQGSRQLIQAIGLTCIGRGVWVHFLG